LCIWIEMSNGGEHASRQFLKAEYLHVAKSNSQCRIDVFPGQLGCYHCGNSIKSFPATQPQASKSSG
jgi:hypothetical protein